ncbi:MAG: MFS transporter, partial [Micromonosporaceae bacterium]
LAGAGLPWLTIGAITLMQRRSPPHLQGRVFSGFDLAVTVPQVLSIALGAALIELVGYQTLLLIGAGVMALAAALMLRVHRRDVRAADPTPTTDEDLVGSQAVSRPSPEPAKAPAAQGNA